MTEIDIDVTLPSHHLSAKMFEDRSCEWFGKQVADLVLRVDLLDGDAVGAVLQVRAEPVHSAIAKLRVRSVLFLDPCW